MGETYWTVVIFDAPVRNNNEHSTNAIPLHACFTEEIIDADMVDLSLDDFGKQTDF
jgi:hypothetical protein